MITDAGQFDRATAADSAGDGLGAAAALVCEARDGAVRRGDVGCAAVLTSLVDVLRRTDAAQAAGNQRRRIVPRT